MSVLKSIQKVNEELEHAGIAIQVDVCPGHPKAYGLRGFGLIVRNLKGNMLFEMSPTPRNCGGWYIWDYQFAGISKQFTKKQFVGFVHILNRQFSIGTMLMTTLRAPNESSKTIHTDASQDLNNIGFEIVATYYNGGHPGTLDRQYLMVFHI